MPVICLGPVCVPLHLLLPFLLGLAHQYGWLTFIKREWLTLVWWRALLRRWLGYPDPAPPQPGGAARPAGAAAPAAEEGKRLVCDGDSCRWVPCADGGEAAAAAGPAAAAGAAGPSAAGAAPEALRRRAGAQPATS